MAYYENEAGKHIMRALLLITLTSVLLTACQQGNQNSQKDKQMFEWIKSLTPASCPKLDKSRYPKIDPEADALFQKAYKADDVAPRVISQEEVVKLYQQAAEKGHWVAMNNLAVSYYQGYGIKQDEKKALYWYQQIEKFDIPEGYTNMATVYRKGIGVKSDEKRAVAYMDKAAQLGDPDAQFMVGKYLYSPLGRKPDAYKILHCAIEQGHRKAAFELALHYDVDENFDMAYKIYRKGAKLGSDSCINALKKAYAHVSKYPTFGLNKDIERAKCLKKLVDEALERDPNITFPDLDERCPANVDQPTNRD